MPGLHQSLVQPKKPLLVSFITASLLVFAMQSHQAQAEEAPSPNWQEDTLTGDWGGLRQAWYAKGVDIGVLHKSDVLSNVSGGLKRGTAWLGHTEIRATFDLDKLLGFSEATANFVYQSDLGSKFNTHYVGAFMGVDNIEVGTNTAQFYEAWLQKNFLDGHVSVLAGLYPVDTEFYVHETSGIFIQPPYGMANEIAQTGVNGPPVFPLGALAVRLKLTSPNEHFYMQAAITDGVPGDPDDPRGTHIKLGNGDGTFSIVEIGYTPRAEAISTEQVGSFNKTAIGFWGYSNQFDAIDGSDSRHRSHGVYVIAERSLFAGSAQPSQGLAGFVRFGRSTEKVNQIDWSGSLGLRYHGLISGRDDDVAGVAVTVNHNGKNYRQANNAEHQEVNYEATYRVQLKPYFAIQPSLQYITNPSMDKGIKNVTVLGLRTEITF